MWSVALHSKHPALGVKFIILLLVHCTSLHTMHLINGQWDCQWLCSVPQSASHSVLNWAWGWDRHLWYWGLFAHQVAAGWLCHLLKYRINEIISDYVWYHNWHQHSICISIIFWLGLRIPTVILIDLGSRIVLKGKSELWMIRLNSS